LQQLEEEDFAEDEGSSSFAFDSKGGEEVAAPPLRVFHSTRSNTVAHTTVTVMIKVWFSRCTKLLRTKSPSKYANIAQAVRLKKQRRE
jgi:hypothetical protein